MRNDQGAVPFLIACGGIALLTIVDSLVKHLAGGFGTFEIVFLRSFFMAAWVGAYFVFTRPAWLKPGRLGANALRAALMLISIALFYYALGRLPLAEAFALSFTSPIFIVLAGAVLLRERLNAAVIAAVMLGFAGVIVIAWTSLGGASAADGQSWLAIAAAILCPVTYALGIVLLRSQTAHEAPALIVLVQALFVALFASPFAAADFRLPDAPTLAIFVLAGLLAALGQLAYAHALSRADAGRLSAVEYTGLLWAALIGYLFFAEVPGLGLWIGSALIIGGCVFALRAKAAA